MIKSNLFTVILTHPKTVLIEITGAGVTISTYSEGGQDLRLSLRVVPDHGVEGPVWCRLVTTARYDEGVVHLHSTCLPTVLSYSLDNN